MGKRRRAGPAAGLLVGAEPGSSTRSASDEFKRRRREPYPVAVYDRVFEFDLGPLAVAGLLIAVAATAFVVWRQRRGG